MSVYPLSGPGQCHGAAAEVLEVVCVNSILGGALAGLLSAGCCWPRRCQENGSTIGQLVPTTAHCSGGHLYHDTHFHFNNEIKLDASTVSRSESASGVGGGVGSGALCAG